MDWNIKDEATDTYTNESLLMWECGLKQKKYENAKEANSHSLCGSVDWNIATMIAKEPEMVTPYVGVWIETVNIDSGGTISRSLLMWECGLKHLSMN